MQEFYISLKNSEALKALASLCMYGEAKNKGERCKGRACGNFLRKYFIHRRGERERDQNFHKTDYILLQFFTLFPSVHSLCEYAGKI